MSTGSTGSSETMLDVALRAREIPALNALRAIAVLLVMGYHFGYKWVPGAYGVIAFFVLSGFLITWLLLREHERNGRISLSAFYARRALRIFPAFYAFAFAWIAVLLVSGREVPWGQALSSMVYGSNYYNALLGDPNTGFSHTWSLAIEEQFYLLWPVALIWLLRRSEHLLQWLMSVIVGIWALRVVLALGVGIDGGYIYAAFETRADALLIGCLLAVTLQQRRARTLIRGATAHPLLTLVPIGVIVLMTAHLPGIPRQRDTVAFAVVPVCFAVLLIQMVAFHASVAWCWVQHPAVRYLGRISYPMYLYQQVVLQPVGHRLAFLPGPLPLLGGCLATILAAAVSYRLVEQPFLRLKRRFAVVSGPLRRAPALVPVSGEA